LGSKFPRLEFEEEEEEEAEGEAGGLLLGGDWGSNMVKRCLCSSFRVYSRVS
jgi:hypothetical protein